MGKLDGKVAFVTGAAHGIGRATARRFGQEGATVVIADIDRELGPETAATLVEEGLAAKYVETDVAIDESLKHSIDFTAERHGRIDILINNATWSSFGKVTELSKEDWDRSIATGLTSVFLGSKYAIPYMQRQGARLDSQHKLDIRPGWRPEQGGVLQHEGRHREPHPEHGPRLHWRQHSCQLRLPRRRYDMA